jgi:DNA-binding protein Fis
MENKTKLDRIEEYFLTNKKGEIYSNVIDDIESRLIKKALEYSFGNQVLAAKMLGINRNTLHAKVKKLNIDVESFKK